MEITATLVQERDDRGWTRVRGLKRIDFRFLRRDSN